MAPSNCPHLVLQAMAGPLAAATASTVTNPMDVIRARVQVISFAHSIRQQICIAGTRDQVCLQNTDNQHNKTDLALYNYTVFVHFLWFSFSIFWQIVPECIIWLSDCLLVQVEGRTSVTETFNQLIREEGFWGMTKGLSARIISSTPTAIVMAVGYETLKKLSLRPELVDSRHWWKRKRNFTVSVICPNTLPLHIVHFCLLNLLPCDASVWHYWLLLVDYGDFYFIFLANSNCSFWALCYCQ